MKYDTFICYRGKSVSDGISEKLAAQIYNAIWDNPDFGRVFFAPACGNYNFIERAESIISEVKRFIVVLCPDFFKGFLKEDGTPDKKESATYNELLAAFKNKNLSFVPVFAMNFWWSDENKAIVNNIYGADFDTDRLFHMTGLHLPTGDFSASQVKKLIDDGKDSRTEQLPSSRERLEKYLSYCIGTVMSEDALILLEDMTEREVGERSTGYTTDVYEFMRACNENSNIMLMPKRFIDEFNKQKEVCRLDDNGFCYWKLDFGSDSEYGESISVCSVCFGAILSYYFLKNDLFRMEGLMSEEERQGAAEFVKKVTLGAVNLLIALRSPVEKTWPSNWEFIARNGHINAQFIEGTINQTTLSLSTLLICDFLPAVKGRAAKDVPSEEREIFKKRYEYISESIEKLIDCRIIAAKRRWCPTESGWGYMPSSKRRRPLPTSFGFDVLTKFKRTISDWKDVFSVSDSEFYAELVGMTEKIDSILSEIILTFSEHQREDGAFTMQGNPEAAPSVTHTAKVLKSLLTYDNFSKDAVIDEKINKVINRSIDFLMNFDPHYVVKGLPDEEIFENFKYSDAENSKGESYENSGELLYVDALAKAAEREYKFGNVERARELFLKSRSVFNRFASDESGFVRIDGESGDDVLMISGRNPNLRYPIFRLYFYRMVVDDLLKYMDLDGGVE